MKVSSWSVWANEKEGEMTRPKEVSRKRWVEVSTALVRLRWSGSAPEVHGW